MIRSTLDATIPMTSVIMPHRATMLPPTRARSLTLPVVWVTRNATRTRSTIADRAKSTRMRVSGATMAHHTSKPTRTMIQAASTQVRALLERPRPKIASRPATTATPPSRSRTGRAAIFSDWSTRAYACRRVAAPSSRAQIPKSVISESAEAPGWLEMTTPTRKAIPPRRSNIVRPWLSACGSMSIPVDIRTGSG